MKNLIQLFIYLISSVVFSQTTAILDDKFEQTLIDYGIDSDNTINNQVLTSDINQITQLDLSTSNNLPIKNLIGIEDFTALKILNINGIGYDFEYIDGRCYLDLSNLQDLEELYFTSKETTHSNKLDLLFLSNNPNLKKLESLDVSYLTTIDLAGTDLSNLNLVINLEGDDNEPDCCRDICINVTNPTDAQNAQGVYSNWNDTYTNNSNHIINYSNTCPLYLKTEISEKIEVSIYPNPAKELLHIKSKLPIEKAILYDLTGKKIKTYFSNQLSESIDVSNIPSGIYFINLQSEQGKQATKKIIVK